MRPADRLRLAREGPTLERRRQWLHREPSKDLASPRVASAPVVLVWSRKIRVSGDGRWSGEEQRWAARPAVPPVRWSVRPAMSASWLPAGEPAAKWQPEPWLWSGRCAVGNSAGGTASSPRWQGLLRRMLTASGRVE